MIVTSLLLALAPAFALDGHGATVLPAQPGVIDARYTWDGELEKGAWSFGALGEVIEQPLTVSYNSGVGVTEDVALMDDVYGLNLRGAVSISRRLGFGIVVPVWLSSVEWSASTGDEFGPGTRLGDIHVSVPVGILTPEDGQGLALGAVAELVAPTGSSDLLYGNGFGGGAHLAAGYRSGMLHLAGNVGVQGATDAQLDNVDQRLALRGSALVGVQPFSFGGAAVELWTAPGLLSGVTAASTPAEVSLHVSGLVGRHVSITGGYGVALGSGAGASRGRVTVGVGWQQRPASGPTLEPVVNEPVTAGPPTPYDILVTATDARGKPVDAHLHVQGNDTAQDWQLGDDGKTRVPLAPGEWALTLSAAGQETQERRFTLEPGRWRPAELEARLMPRTGDERLSVLVTDNEAHGVETAEVTVDNESRGTTSNTGVLILDGVAHGDHEVRASQGDFTGPASLTVAATPTGNDTTFTDMPAAVVTLERPPGAVRVVTRSNQGAVADAAVRFLGAGSDTGEPQEEHGAEAIGADGERTFQLTPGRWTAVVSAAAFGVQERDIVIEPGQTTLVSVDVVLAASVGAAGLSVRVVDTDGRPVEGAEVRINDAPVGATSNVGTLSLGGLAAGNVAVTVRGKGLLPTPPRTVELVAGQRDIVISVDYSPGTVQILARGPDGPVRDAMVRFIGPDNQPASALGPDGRGMYSLKGGDWEVVLSSAEFGLQSRNVTVRPDETSLIFIDARLLVSEKGGATLSLSVQDADGRPVEGARIRLDGSDVGTTSTGGDLSLGSLQPGTRSVAVTGDIFQDYASDAVELKPGTNAVAVKLKYRTTVIRLRAHDPANAPVDAVVRLYGAIEVAPASLGSGGERLFALTAGAWTVALSSETMGVSEKSFDVVESPTPQLVDMLVTPPVKVVTSLRLVAIDASGSPVRGVTATIGTQAQALGDDGSIKLEGLQPGPLPLKLSAPGYTPVVDAAFALATGPQERVVRLDALPRNLGVKVVDPKGKPVDAAVIVQRESVSGTAVKAVQAGADGIVEGSYQPGSWRVVVAAPDYGAQQQDVRLPAGEGTFAVVMTLTRANVEVTAEQVTIRDQVHFPTNSAAISADSFRILDEVASTLLVHPELRAVEIQGHTDDVGGAEYNLDLSQRRANAVRLYLVSKGIEAGRLQARGYGLTVPIAPNTSESGRSKNRRVQFVIRNEPSGADPAPVVP